MFGLDIYQSLGHVCTPEEYFARQNRVTQGPKAKGLKAELARDTLGHKKETYIITGCN